MVALEYVCYTKQQKILFKEFRTLVFFEVYFNHYKWQCRYYCCKLPLYSSSRTILDVIFRGFNEIYYSFSSSINSIYEV